MKDASQFKNSTYNLYSYANNFLLQKVKTTFYGIKSIQYLAVKICEEAPENIKTH